MKTFLGHLWPAIEGLMVPQMPMKWPSNAYFFQDYLHFWDLHLTFHFFFGENWKKKVQIQFYQTVFMRHLQGNLQGCGNNKTYWKWAGKSATLISLDFRHVLRSPAFQGHFYQHFKDNLIIFVCSALSSWKHIAFWNLLFIGPRGIP